MVETVALSPPSPRLDMQFTTYPDLTAEEVV